LARTVLGSRHLPFPKVAGPEAPLIGPERHISHIGKNAPSLQDIGDADMARSRRRGVSPTRQQNCYVLSLAM
jgi:hypothetical protein